MNERVDIVMATYNGMPYIREQLQSILWQDYPQFRLLIHDDGSTDGTVEEIRKVAERYPHKVFFIEDGITFKDAKKNFEHLLKMTDADYIFLADQDDVWLPSKVSVMVSKLKEVESQSNEVLPVLTYSDYLFINAVNSIIYIGALKKIQKWYPRISLNMMLVYGKLPGCVSAMNRALLKIALPIPEEASWHDHWLSLVACSCGRLIHIPYTTTLYRIHGKNTIGFKEEPTLFSRMKRWFHEISSVVSNIKKEGELAKLQAEALLCRLQTQGCAREDSVKTIEEFLGFFSAPFCKRAKYVRAFVEGDFPHRFARLILWH